MMYLSDVFLTLSLNCPNYPMVCESGQSAKLCAVSTLATQVEQGRGTAACEHVMMVNGNCSCQALTVPSCPPGSRGWAECTLVQRTPGVSPGQEVADDHLSSCH